MFVAITNGSMTLTVPKGAYLSQYAPQGWKEITAEDLAQEVAEELEAEEVVEAPTLTEAEPEDSDGEEVTEEEEYEEVDINELLEKPVTELDMEELQLVAEHKKIDISGITSAKEIRKLIRQAE